MRKTALLAAPAWAKSCIAGLLVACLFAGCRNLGGSADLIPVKKNGKYGFINEKGKVVIPFSYYRAGCFDGGLAIVSNDFDGKWGFIDNAGRFAIAPVYTYASSFSEGIAFVTPDGGVPTAIDKNSVPLFHLPHAQAAQRFSEGLAAFSILDTTGEKWGFVDKKGSVKITPAYRAVSYFSGGLCAVMNARGRWSYIDKTGKQVISPRFVNAFPFVNGQASICEHGKWGLIDKHGDYVLDPGYEELEADGEDYLVKKQGQWGWVNQQGKETIPLQFDDAYPFHGNKYAPVANRGKWGYIDRDGMFIIAPRYSFAFGFREGMAAVELDGRYGFIDPKGKYIVSPTYDRLPVDYYIRYLTTSAAYYSVQTDTARPGTVAYKWLSAFYRADKRELRRLSTRNTFPLIDNFSRLVELLPAEEKKRMNGLDIGIKNTEFSGNRAIVTYTLSDSRQQAHMLFLEKQGSKWLVQFGAGELAATPGDTAGSPQ